MAIRTVLTEYAVRCANQSVAAYAESQLAAFQNPNVDKICKILSQFNAGWTQQLEDFWKEEGRVAKLVEIGRRGSEGMVWLIRRRGQGRRVSGRGWASHRPGAW
jgi:hypothetical protein